MSSGARPQDGAAPAPPVPLLRNRGFRLLWIGQVLSDTGTEAALIAYPLLILALTDSPALAGIVGTVRLVVQLVLGLPAGAIADRLDHRLTMIACDTGRGAVLALLATLVLVHLATWPVVLVAAVIDGGASVLFDPSASAALPAIVADEQLERAWAATEARTYAASLAGPALGGFLFALGRAVPFLTDAASYLVSAGSVSRIRGTFRAGRPGPGTGLWRDVTDGLQLVWRQPLLRAVVIQAPLVNFAFNGVIFTITVALRQHGTPPGAIGLTQAGIAVGGLLGAVVAPWLQGRLPLWRLVIIFTAIAAVLFGAAAVLLPSTLVALPVAVTLLLSPAANAALFAAMLRAAPAHMRGRVTSTVVQAAMGLAALAPLASGLLVEHFSGPWALAAFAAVTGISAVMFISLPGLRKAEAATRPGTKG
ncbi:MAG TPA: MFS transporter [Streptosporangiaceae bacterium]|nr:MFS transporter [Streptosporangiaceae bacterium]